jgi:hypothetical protein
MATIEQIKIGDRLDMSMGSMVYIGDGKADAYVTGKDGKDELYKSGVALTQAMIDDWVRIVDKQANTPSVHMCAYPR